MVYKLLLGQLIEAIQTLPPEAPKKEDNSLLTSTNSVKGNKIGDLAKVTTSMIPNLPGVYAIRCKINNKHYIGESKNLKERIPKHYAQIREGKSNEAFAQDFNTYGKDNFELILVQSGADMLERSVRLNLESRIQQLLMPMNLCYNTGRAETKTARPEGLFPTAAGFYIIRCKINNTVYIGETGQRKGVSGRLGSWKQHLKNEKIVNQKLLADWKLYGDDGFEFNVIKTGPEWDDVLVRKAEEVRLISEYRAKGIPLYNFTEEEKKAPRSHLAAKDSILKNQSPEYRQYISQLNKDKPNLEGRKAIVANGNVYLHINEAAECLGYGKNRNPVKNALKNGKFRLATEQELEAECLRRAKGHEPIVVPRTRGKQTGTAKRVLVNYPEKGINNQVFASFNEASKALGISVQAVTQAVKRGSPKFTVLD